MGSRVRAALAAPTLVGRADERARVAEAIAGGARVVTLVGAPGMGKSALAAALAPRGAARVPLATVRTRDALEIAIASALGARSGALVAALGARARWLVLDDADGVVDALAELLDAAPRARAIVTTRARAARGIAGEVVMEIGPLAHGDALALFDAQRAAAGLGPEEDRDALTRLVTRLDGCPLALVLAAARSAVCSASELDAALASGPATLAAPAPPAGARHASLVAAIDDSLGALPPALADSLAALAVLPAGFGAPMAAAVLGLPPPATSDVLAALRARSLLEPCDAPGTGERRFAVRAMVRDVLSARLDPALRERSLARATSALERRALERAEPPLGPRTPEGSRLLEAERSALETALAGELGGATRVALALGLDVALERGADAAARAEMLAAERARSGAASPWLDHALARALASAGRHERALAIAEQALGAIDRDAEPVLAAALLMRTGSVRWVRGEHGAARRDLGEALARAAAEPRAHGRVLAEVAYLAFHGGEAGPLPTARRLAEARSLLVASGDVLGVARADVLAGLVRLHVGDVAGAADALESALTTLDRASDPDRKLARLTLGLARAELGALDAARGELARAIELAASTGAVRAHALYRAYAGAVELADGDLASGVRWLAGAVPDLEAAGDRRQERYFEALLVLGRRLLGEPAADPREDTEQGARDPAERRARVLAVEVARCIAADEPVDAAVRAAIDAGAEGGTVRGDELRLVLRIAARARDRAPRGASIVRVSADGERVQVGERAMISLAGSAVLARIVIALAGCAPRRLDVGALFAAGWPGERALPISARQRVHAAVKRLRRLGLEPVLRSNREGYWLDATGVRDG